MYVGDGDAIQRAVVGGLSAALGIESGAVQRDEKAFFGFLTGEDGSFKFG